MFDPGRLGAAGQFSWSPLQIIGPAGSGLTRTRVARLCILVPILVFLAACTQINLKQLTRPDKKELAAIRVVADKGYTAEDWAIAEGAYRTLTETVPREAENWFRLGNIFVLKGHPNEAIALYREALVRDPRHSKAWQNLGLTQLRAATNTFVEMQESFDSSDPAHELARRMVNGITRLLENEQRSAGTDPR